VHLQRNLLAGGAGLPEVRAHPQRERGGSARSAAVRRSARRRLGHSGFVPEQRVAVLGGGRIETSCCRSSRRPTSSGRSGRPTASTCTSRSAGPAPSSPACQRRATSATIANFASRFGSASAAPASVRTDGAATEEEEEEEEETAPRRTAIGSVGDTPRTIPKRWDSSHPRSPRINCGEDLSAEHQSSPRINRGEGLPAEHRARWFSTDQLWRRSVRRAPIFSADQPRRRFARRAPSTVVLHGSTVEKICPPSTNLLRGSTVENRLRPSCVSPRWHTVLRCVLHGSQRDGSLPSSSPSPARTGAVRPLAGAVGGG
jgi:hypothetical protein